jgi:hypothetical protein
VEQVPLPVLAPHFRERRKAILLRKPYLRASGKPFGTLA